ncbi:MAG: thioesterase family protein [Vicingaceae bacterium]|nr:thioesterase family protein [Vicingaceae bacterium]
MFSSETKVSVRYAETDKMGYCYYGNYATYFEVARVEMIKKLGFSYKQMEDEGVALPVLEFNIKYFKPAFYDEEITIKTVVTEKPAARITFDYECYNESEVLLNKASTTLVFVNMKTGRPQQAPADFLEAIEKHF